MKFFRYNTSNNWVDYMSIVSDIRTICPLSNLAAQISAPMYVATQPRDNAELGNIADKSADLAAIFATSDDDIPFQDNVRTMFYEFVREGTSFEGMRLVGAEIEPVESLENCDFWQEVESQIVPAYGKIF